MSNLLGSKTWTLPIGDSNGTVTIALSFIFLAYILHPAIEAAYHRLRAYRAWRAIQKRKTVNVTNYPLLAEIFGGRGLWDGARIITVLLLAFSLASWGLELSMGLASLEGEADLLNRPPPVFLNSDLETAYVSENNDFPWQVINHFVSFSGALYGVFSPPPPWVYGSFSFRRAAATTQLTHGGHITLMIRKLMHCIVL